MNSIDNAGRVQKCLLDLSRLILRKDAVPDDLLGSLRRHLRPADAESVTDFHFNALRHRLRNSLLTQSINANRKEDGPILASKLDKEMDRLRRGGFRQLTAFLALIEPLSFRQIRTSSFLVASNTVRNILSDDDATWLEAGKVEQGHEARAGVESMDAQATISEALTWISPDVEAKLIKDLLFIFQV